MGVQSHELILKKKKINYRRSKRNRNKNEILTYPMMQQYNIKAKKSILKTKSYTNWKCAKILLHISTQTQNTTLSTIQKW